MKTFEGFPAELADFWFELHEKNTVYNADEIKEKYKTYITAPSTQLYETLLPTVLDISENLELIPSRCISTPYTDRRFSYGTPFKEYLYLRFKQCGKKTDIPGFYFDMGVKMYSYGLRIYKQTASGMREMRENILKNPEAFSNALDAVLAGGFKIIGEDYKADHFPDLADSSAKLLLNKKSFHIGKNKDVSPVIFTAQLADEIRDGFQQMKTVFRVFEA